MAGRARRRGRGHLVGEHRARGVDGGELQLLLRAEVREEAALAHADGLGEAADREPVDALDRRQARGLVEDRVSAPRSCASPRLHVRRVCGVPSS